MNVLVLGCGPAGLMAALGAEVCGAIVSIASVKKPSHIGGAQYLHKPLPVVNDGTPDGIITVLKHGTREGYANKLYGVPDKKTSWDDYEDGQRVEAWDLRRTYEILWARFEDQISDIKLDPLKVRFLLEEDTYDRIISTIPLPFICAAQSAHEFNRQNIHISRNAPMVENTIIWNGETHTPWYRASRVFGVTGGYEYPANINLPNPEVARKPLSTDCDCWPTILRAGRYGAWDKSLLTHDAYQVVVDALQ